MIVAIQLDQDPQLRGLVTPGTAPQADMSFEVVVKVVQGRLQGGHRTRCETTECMTGCKPLRMHVQERQIVVGGASFLERL